MGRASHTSLVVVCTELYMGGGHPPAAESLSGNHSTPESSTRVERLLAEAGKGLVIAQ